MSHINNNKGNWEFNFFQKKYDPIGESNIKMSMKPENGFNPNNIHQYINPEISKEELIIIKKEKGIKLKTNELIILENYIKKKNDMIKSDINMIKTLGLSAKPITNEGRTRLLLHTLDYELKKNNIDFVANIFLRLMEDQFEITDDIEKDYVLQINKMNSIIEKTDLIKLQFTKFYSQMPPLNNKGFTKFDDWQINVINNIDNNISTIINAPTSAGKSVLSGYATTKGRSLFVVPTDVLAWQMSAYIGNILNSNIPILTTTYQTNPSRDEMIELLNKAPAIIGTSDCIMDYLPFIKNDFKWIILDEVHMIGKPEGCAMEYIAKLLNNVPILALSATIKNTDEIMEWFQRISPQQKISKIICDKRFFNLQRYYYDTDNNKIIMIHPLSLIDEEQISNGSLLEKNLQPTPPDIWDLSMKLIDKFDIGELDPYKYFTTEKRIELDEANKYFDKLINFIVNKYKTDKEIIMGIINSYKYTSLITNSPDLINLCFKLKEENKTPAIIFQKNTIACLRIAREFAKRVENLEAEKYPKLVQDRIKLIKAAKRLDKKNKDIIDDDKNNKKATKQLMGNIKLKKGSYGKDVLIETENKPTNFVSLQEPHNNFIFNSNEYFNESIVEGWVEDLKKYFPNTGEYYHFIIKLLWRGVGVYAKGLPDPYLRLVQTLACKKQLAIVFSDESLVFGVSMPFRTVVIVRDNKLNDDLDPMMFHQMSGRAGRRGLDKEGNIIFAGYSWDRIKELSISESPVITGTNNIIYTIPHANRISEIYNTNQNWDIINRNFLNKEINEDDMIEFTDNIKSNLVGGWNFAIKNNDINHLYLNWKLRYNDDCLLTSLLLPYLKKGFEGLDHTQEKNQIDIAHFLCRFISTKPTNNKYNLLQDPEILLINPFNQINNELENLQIDIPNMIDNKLFQSIQQNVIVNTDDNELRQQLFEFGDKIKNIQHFCFHSKITGLSKLLGKLLTRIWWIYHCSSPIMKTFYEYENDNLDTK